MGAADDIKKGLTKNLATFTKQRKAEEKSVSAGRWRTSRMREVRGEYQTEVAAALMRQCYMKASDNNQLPATARQIFYVARPLFEDRTGKPLDYAYFSQTLLPNYINEHSECAKWDMVYDDRGHFTEPHTNNVIGLGTLAVRDYLSGIYALKLAEADFGLAWIKTYGPSGCYGAILYVEKEGFMPLFKRVRLAQRFDIAIMSSEGHERDGRAFAGGSAVQNGTCRSWCCTISIPQASSSKTRSKRAPAAIATRTLRPSSISACATATSTVCRSKQTTRSSAMNACGKPASTTTPSNS